MLDRYLFANVERISPESPVPIANINKQEDRLGAAANVAKNIISLGGQEILLTTAGYDNASNDLISLLNQENVEYLLSQHQENRTIVKLRVMAKNQQLIRLDFDHKPIDISLDKLADNFISVLPQCSVVIFSDYAKGSLKYIANLIKLAIDYGKLVLVDPKGTDYSKYTGATIVTPNLAELRMIIGEWHSQQELIAKAEQLRMQLHLKFLLVTMGEKGMLLLAAGIQQHYPALAKEVYDVSGAGDTVIATLALMLTNNMNLPDAISIANKAAGIVVAKVGTAVVTLEELQL